MYCRECNTERTGPEICWKCNSALEEVKHDHWHPLNMPPLERVRELAKECGYACAMHGSQERDLDVVLVAWTDEALTRTYAEVMHYIAAGLIAENGLPARVVEIEAKPLGRHACTIQMNGWYKAIDLSMAAFIAPKLTNEQALDVLEGADYIDGKPNSREPDWHTFGSDTVAISLDGRFTREELLAVLHFHPDNLPVGTTIGWPEPKEKTA
jgi:hypothetical protein